MIFRSKKTAKKLAYRKRLLRLTANDQTKAKATRKMIFT